MAGRWIEKSLRPLPEPFFFIASYSTGTIEFYCNCDSLTVHSLSLSHTHTHIYRWVYNWHLSPAHYACCIVVHWQFWDSSTRLVPRKVASATVYTLSLPCNLLPCLVHVRIKLLYTLSLSLLSATCSSLFSSFPLSLSAFASPFSLANVTPPSHKRNDGHIWCHHVNWLHTPTQDDKIKVSLLTCTHLSLLGTLFQLPV